VKVPTLILAPANSPVTALADQFAMRDAIPNAHLVIVDCPGHEIYINDAETCIDAFTRFVDGVRSS
jgi:pimeloyl-ACP methyl ester carboxylesterase